MEGEAGIETGGPSSSMVDSDNSEFEEFFDIGTFYICLIFWFNTIKIIIFIFFVKVSSKFNLFKGFRKINVNF